MTTTYFKAVRPEGTDFHTGTVDYVFLCGTGRALPVLSGPARLCTTGVYHASTEPGETLVGGHWPCRLFLVTGHAVASEGTKRGFRTLKVVQEIPAYRALGPNGEAVAAFLGRIPLLTPAQREDLARALPADPDGIQKLHVVHFLAGYAADDGFRHAALVAARSASRLRPPPSSFPDFPASVNYVLRYAATALVVQDLLTPEDFRVLYGPWESVMGTVR